jgi:hypothetical protein
MLPLGSVRSVTTTIGEAVVPICATARASEKPRTCLDGALETRELLHGRDRRRPRLHLLAPLFAARARFEAVAQESGPGEQRLRRGREIRDEENLVDAEFALAHRVGDDHAPLEDGAVGSVRGHRAVVVEAILPALHERVCRAANADARKRRAHAIAVLVDLADEAGERANAAAHEVERDTGNAVVLAGEVVFGDLELALRAHRDDRLVGQAQLRAAPLARANHVALLDGGARGERHIAPRARRRRPHQRR